MNDKEKKAIELLKKLRFSSDEYYIVDGAYVKNIDYMLILNAIQTVLNMIDEYEVACNCGKQVTETLNFTIRKFQKDIKKQKAEIEKKDKIINLMAEELVKAHEWFYSKFDNYTKEDFIKYFEKKAEEDKQC